MSPQRSVKKKKNFLSNKVPNFDIMTSQRETAFRNWKIKPLETSLIFLFAVTFNRRN